jgi:type II secretory pathway predicted ATPase ExeA
MYEEFFGLKARPFLTVPDPDFLYWSEAHSLAFSILRYGVMTRAPITVITGEIGAGKTTLLRRLLREAPEDLTVGLVSNFQPGRGELLHWALMALGESVGDEPYVALFTRFQDTVVRAYAEGRRVALVFDEAQNLDPAALEQLRMLSNINAEKDELLQLILVGQPQLRDLLARPDLVQFAQRISADFHLGALTEEDVEAYVQHRLEVAGAALRIFPPEACRLVHRACRGVPRLVNILCDLGLVYAFSIGAREVSEATLAEFLDSARRRGIYTQFAPVGPLSAEAAPLARRAL